MRRLIVGLSLFFWLCQVYASALPSLGESSDSDLSPIMQQSIARQIKMQLQSDPSYFPDSEITDYLNRIEARLSAHSTAPQMHIHVFVIKSSVINADAMPGQLIGVNTALISATDTESELAAVLAHETSHITQHHFSRSINENKKNGYLTLAGLALSIFAAYFNPEMAGAGLTATGAGNIQAQISDSREHEEEADRIGFDTLVAAGFDPHGMADFFKKLQNMTRLDQVNYPEYLHDHPMTTNRIAEAENRADQYPYHQVASSLDYFLVKARLKALQGTPEAAIRHFQRTLGPDSYGYPIANHYGLALALARNHQYKSALKQLDIAQSMGKSSFFNALGAAILEADGKTDAALKVYNQALGTWPNNRTLLRGKISLLIDTKHYNQAIRADDTALESHPHDDVLYQLKAQVYSRLDENALQHKAQAEAYYYEGNIRAAIDQLQIARNSKRVNYFTLASIQSRLKHFKEEYAFDKTVKTGL
ncbi:MAG: M48 family metallopeptidase [Pseudomonadota bacterium]|nr:M48 family metallopeptidase [Pseudomonadota bacterium]